jgi:glyoxylase-like metal-dependent hydrolase (beta-lactamase superfamily II)
MPHQHSSSAILHPTRRTFLALAAAAAIDAVTLPVPLHATPTPASTPAPTTALDPDWTTPLPPFRIAGNIHYVGSRDLASYLITTPRGHILINTNIPTSPTQIRASIEKLGFTLPQVKVLLISHAHSDHCGGSAEILKLSGAKYMVMDGDVPVVESGGKQDFQYGNRPEMLYPPAKVERTLHDGDQVQLGGVILTARKTAGHTKGLHHLDHVNRRGRQTPQRRIRRRT